MEINKGRLDHIMEYKTNRLIELLVEEKGVSKEEALEIWNKSNTKQEIWDKDEYKFVSITRCLDELEKELENDPFWLMGSFE